MAQCVVCSSEIRDDARFCPSCGAEQPKAEVAGTDADPLMGKIVAKKFKVEKLLGVGGMGKVYKARQLSLDKAVVVKVLHDHFREDPQLVQRFQREAKAASRLNHPNSIQIIDFGQDEGGVVFMAMEFLQGTDLFAALKKDGPMPADRIAKIMIQVCSALGEAHEQHVVHRDLKPENIMVEDRRGQKDYVKVLDFGIAKIQDPGEGQQQLTQAGMVCGTPEYMSPEQARGLQLDPRSDIYALGVVMYQLAVGELPFVADTPIGIVTKHILEKPVPPRQRAPQLNIPEELENIIMKAMEKEADKRFNTVTEMGEALEVMLHNVAPFHPPKTGDGSGAHRLADKGTGPVPKLPDVSGPTTTKPTPAGPSATVAVPATQQTNVEAARPSGGGGGVKIAAAAFAGVLVVALAVVVAIKVLKTPSTTSTDAGVVAVADAGYKPPKVADAGIVTPAVNRDAGLAVVDAGIIKEPPPPPPPPPPKVDAGVKVVEHPHPSGGDRAAAEKVFREGHAKFGNEDCAGAMPLLIQAGKLDQSYGEPLRDIAMCARKAGNKDGACSAAKEFVKRKHMTGVNADNTLAVFCNP